MNPLRQLALPALLALLATGPLLLLAGPAAAGPEDRESAFRWFDGVDTDRDEIIGPEEMERVRDKRFDRYDGNRDGSVTLDEFNFALPDDMGDEIERRRRRFAVMDLDDDGQLTREEYLQFGARVIQEADIDGDGSITRAEFADTVAPQ